MNKYTLTTTSGHQCDATTDTLTNLPTYPVTDQPITDRTTTTSTSSSTSRACARAREENYAPPQLPPVERLHQTRDLYQENIGRMSPQVGRTIERYLLAGMQLEVIEEAIAETSWAPRPSPNYLMAILRRYMDDHVMSLDDLIQDRIRHEADKEVRRSRRAARWYDEGEFDPLPF